MKVFTVAMVCTYFQVTVRLWLAITTGATCRLMPHHSFCSSWLSWQHQVSLASTWTGCNSALVKHPKENDYELIWWGGNKKRERKVCVCVSEKSTDPFWNIKLQLNLWFFRSADCVQHWWSGLHSESGVLHWGSLSYFSEFEICMLSSANTVPRGEGGSLCWKVAWLLEWQLLMLENTSSDAI